MTRFAAVTAGAAVLLSAWSAADLLAPDVPPLEAATSEADRPPTELVLLPVERPEDPYEAARFDLDEARRALAMRRSRGEPVHDTARDVLTAHLPALMQAWIGTAYDFNGTSEVPGQGTIACGYFVSTVLEHAGFAVDRVDLARQASEQIIRTLVPDERIARISWSTRPQVVDTVERSGEGVYVVGLDTHVGFLVHDGGETTFCHATSRPDKRSVVCEEALTSPSLKSRFTVVGKLDDQALLAAWLGRGPLLTARKGEPQTALLAWSPASEGSSSHGGSMALLP